MKRIIMIILWLGVGILLASCAANNISPNTYAGSEVGAASKVLSATVVAMRPVHIDNSSGVGGVVGAGTGAVAGSAIGGDTRTNVLGGIGGAVVGGVVGSAIDKSLHKHIGYEYILRVRNKGLISVVQAQDLKLKVGQRVYVIYGAMTRLVPVANYHSHLRS